jgi:DNA-binding IclR family transcriptional regulator
VRRNGYSCDEEQVAEGMICFGAVVLDSRNRPIAGIAVSLPVDSMTAENRQSVIRNVTRIATRLSHRMGADPARADASAGPQPLQA